MPGDRPFREAGYAFDPYLTGHCAFDLDLDLAFDLALDPRRGQTTGGQRQKDKPQAPALPCFLDLF